jgi:hypothetical protein
MIAAALLAMLSAQQPAAPSPRFVVMHVAANVYGVEGTGTITVDRSTGRFVRRFDAGPASEGEGWDGRHAWRSDATGMGRIQGNAGERAEIVQWSAALVHALSAPVSRAVVTGGRDRDVLSFEQYRQRAGLDIPGRIVSESNQNGRWTCVLRKVETPKWISPDAFEVPAPPRDFTLGGVTRVPVSMDGGAPQLDVRVNGVRLRFFLDTGGQNVITAKAAVAAGLHPIGRGIVGGGAGGIVPIQYAFARTVRIGKAEMRHQPFIVLPTRLFGTDGIVGYELLARFGARLDMAHGTVDLAPRATAFGRSIRPVPFGFFDRQPQVRGSIDATQGPITIDTGSSLNTSVQPQVVRTQGLVSRLHASVRAAAQDVGRQYPIYLVRARAMRLGTVVVPDPLLDLPTGIDPSYAPATLANVGDGVLRRWIIVFDYANQILDLRPGGDSTGNTFRDRSGMLLETRGEGLFVSAVLGGTPASVAGIRFGERLEAVDGRSVSARDLTTVRNLLRGAPGTAIRVRFSSGSTRIITLRRYL